MFAVVVIFVEFSVFGHIQQRMFVVMANIKHLCDEIKFNSKLATGGDSGEGVIKVF